MEKWRSSFGTFQYFWGSLVIPILLLSVFIIFTILFQSNHSLYVHPFGNSLNPSEPNWLAYTLADAAPKIAQNNTLIVCTVSEPFLPMLNNWLISVSRQNRKEMVLVIAEDTLTLFKVNQKWPGHAVLLSPPLNSHSPNNFYSQGFLNLTRRRPQHLLQILELGYNVMYNDIDMVWVADPFPYMKGAHDVYFADDARTIKRWNHTLDLHRSNRSTYFCTCMLYLRPTRGSKLLMKKWIEEMRWLIGTKTMNQPPFNWALKKTAGQVDLYLLPQAAFPPGCLYFNSTSSKWAVRTKGMQVIIHNNYIIGLDEKIQRFRDYGLWLVDDFASESPLGIL